MKHPTLTRFVLALVATGAVAVMTGLPGRTPAADATPDQVARGEYLTGNAGQCMDCHGEGLKGGPNMIPGPPGVPWASNVPSLRGLTMFRSDDSAITFLTTTMLPSGKNALAPMPRYKFNRDDAAAIVAYLRSLK